MSNKSNTAVLTLSCPDQRGLVAAVAQFVYSHGGNVIHADQHTDPTEKIFLQRVEWELEGFALGPEETRKAFEPLASQFAMKWDLHLPAPPPKMAIFVSKQGHCMNDLLGRCRLGELRAEVPLIISNHPDMESIAESYGVQFITLPITQDNKVEQEGIAKSLLKDHKVDFIVLARYMQILSADLVEEWPTRIINIHHSFLPAFTGARPYHQAFERGVKIIGATAHYVTSELDQGPIIEQDVTRISHTDDVGDLLRKGRDLETSVLSRAIDLHVRHRVIPYGNKTAVFI